MVFSREKIVINETKHYITFLGDGMNKTIITWNDTAGDFDDSDVLLKTYRSATVGISSEWFIAKGVTFVVSSTHSHCLLGFFFGLVASFVCDSKS